MLFKVNIVKAYDTLSWDYLLSILNFIGFGVKSLSWIKTCLKFTQSSVLVNGSLTKEFSLERRLRQGDPLAPFLFIPAMEDAIEAKLFQGLKFGDINISHLIYADDVIWDNGLNLIS